MRHEYGKNARLQEKTGVAGLCDLLERGVMLVGKRVPYVHVRAMRSKNPRVVELLREGSEWRPGDVEVSQR